MEFIQLEEIDSTQRYAKEHLFQFSKDVITCISAKYQFVGRGPRKTAWKCAKDKGLLLTYVVWQKAAPQLAQVVSIALAKLCIELGLAPQLKWPNDVFLSHKKLAGCMVEARGDASLIGIGLNVLQTETELAEIDQIATSLMLEYGKQLSCEYLLEQLSVLLEEELSLFFKEGFAPFYTQYQTFMKLSPGDVVTARIDDQKREVIFEEFLKDGRLCVRLPNMQFRTLG